jgi:hypothetical protein
MYHTMIETIRPEYLEAVSASRVNLWLLPLFLAAPLLILAPVLRRWHWALVAGLALIAAAATWVSIFGYSETIWKTMEAHARTAAEMEEVASDTGRVFGPFFVGIPAAVFYVGVWCGIAFACRAFMKGFRR